MLTCEVCGKLHPDGTANCDVCGTGLAAWPYVANSDLGQELGLDRLPPNSELGRVLAAPLRELTGALCPFCRQTNRPGATFCAYCGHTLVAPSTGPLPAGTGELAPGTVLNGRYRIIRRVAQGGMGAVYEATDADYPDEPWAIKEMAQTAIAPEERTQALKDFMREATILATLSHPNLPRFNGIFSEDGKHYLVMEFIPGQTLEQIVTHSTAFLPEARVLGWAAQLCSVLTYLHAQDPPIIYRDMKPGNIMLLPGPDERIKLIDFGIARFHRRGRHTDTAAFGTAGYAPPEQYGNGQTDQRSDVYALAATLHHLLTGHDPVQNPFHWRPIRQYNPRVSRQVDQAIMRALELKPELRFPNVDAFAQALGLRPVPATVPNLETAAPPPEAPVPTRPVPASLPITDPIPVPERATRRPERRRDRNGHEPLPIPASLPIPSAPAPVMAQASIATAPAPLTAVPSPVEGPHLEVADPVIDLGRAGRQARRGRPIRLLNTGQGQLKGIVHVTQPWLAASAVQFQGNVGELTVRSRNRGLKLGHPALPVPGVFGWARRTLRRVEGRWAALAWLVLAVWAGAQVGVGAISAVVLGIAALVGLLAAAQVWFWLVARHVRWLVPAPLVNTGEVIVDSNGGQRRIEVRVLARPSWLHQAVAWTITSALLLAELLLLATLLVTQVLAR